VGYNLSGYEKLKKKTHHEKYHLKERIVDLGYPPKKLKDWYENHKKYKKFL